MMDAHNARVAFSRRYKWIGECAIHMAATSTAEWRGQKGSQFDGVLDSTGVTDWVGVCGVGFVYRERVADGGIRQPTSLAELLELLCIW